MQQLMLYAFFTLFTVIWARPSDLKSILEGHSPGKDIYGATIPLELEIFVPQEDPIGNLEETSSSNEEDDEVTIASTTVNPKEELTTVKMSLTTTAKVSTQKEKGVVPTAAKVSLLKNEELVKAMDLDEEKIQQEAKFYFDNINLNLMVGDPDETTGVLVQAALLEDKDVTPELLGNYFEGDLLIPANTQSRAKSQMTSSRWPLGIVPFVISTNYTVSQLAPIYTAMVKIQEATCVQFVQRKQQDDYVNIVNTNTGCWSAVGRIGGAQMLSLQGDGCLRRYSTVLHGLMHVLGFMHEHNRPERDDHVDIHWENVQLGSRLNFQKNCHLRGFGVKYDFESITHYNAEAYSANGNETITAKDDKMAEKMAVDRMDLSTGDIQKINRIYDCKEYDLGIEKKP